MFCFSECDASFTGKSGLCLHIKKIHPKLSEACARVIPYKQASPEKPSSEDLLEKAIKSLDDSLPNDVNVVLSTELLPAKEESLGLLEDDRFSTVNLRDLD